jgi:hypothetical protein
VLDELAVVAARLHAAALEQHPPQRWGVHDERFAHRRIVTVPDQLAQR